MRDILRLVRFPNTLTTIADVIAGAALAGGIGGEDLLPVALACGAMMALYAFGITLNDFLDREKDAIAHPDRPLPSGRVSEGTAKSVMAVTLAIATMLFGSLGLESFLAGCALVVAITLYDAVLPERTLWSTLAMGSCRALSMTSGVVAVAELGILADDGLWIGPAAYVVLVASLTLLSTLEDGDGGRARLGLAVTGIVAAMFAPVLLPHRSWTAPVAAAALAAWALSPLMRTPRIFGLAVRNVVFGLPIFCAIVCLGAGDSRAALAAAAVFPLTRLAARAIDQKGS